MLRRGLREGISSSNDGPRDKEEAVEEDLTEWKVAHASPGLVSTGLSDGGTMMFGKIGGCFR